MKMDLRDSPDRFKSLLILSSCIILLLTGCASTAIDAHKKGVQTVAEKEYFIPKKPVDRHYIGCAWSKQFGPVEDPSATDIRIKVERSFDSMQQNFAYNAGISLGAQSIKGVSSDSAAAVGGVALDPFANTTGVTSPTAVGTSLAKGATVEVGVEGGKTKKSDLESVQIISPVSLADVPFELNIPYITEALRLGNFVMRSQSTGKAGITAEISSAKGGVKGAMDGAGATTGQGLVVAYKLHTIDPKSYSKQDSGSVALELEKTTDFPRARLFVRSQLRVIEAGANKPLPRNLLWSCDRAEATSKDMVAAWIIEVRPKDPKRKSLQIAFPAFPKIEDCQGYSGVIYSRIDPLTDKIIRQKLNITIMQEELSDSLKPIKWEAQVSLVNESFNIKLVRQNDLGRN